MHDTKQTGMINVRRQVHFVNCLEKDDEHPSLNNASNRKEHVALFMFCPPSPSFVNGKHSASGKKKDRTRANERGKKGAPSKKKKTEREQMNAVRKERPQKKKREQREVCVNESLREKG
jgi:hypothetical protein